MGGFSALEGRVELCLNGVWGTICDNFWSNLDATVVCNQLSLGVTDAIAIQGARFGPGVGRIFLNNMFCSGNEGFLTDCTYSLPPMDGSCTHAQDASVRCSGMLSYECVFRDYCQKLNLLLCVQRSYCLKLNACSDDLSCLRSTKIAKNCQKRLWHSA